MDEGRAIYEDEALLAWDKPAGILVHGDGTGARTLTDVVIAHLARKGRGDARPQAVQRLDVETTGLVLFSLDRATQPALDAQVAGHGMRKRYLAVVAGRPPWAERDVRAPIGRDRHDARRMRVCRPGRGKPAETLVRRVAAAGGRSLLLVELLSGRRHQIRVHLASLGFAVAGDGLYGTPADVACARGGGLMLHAWREDLTHPVSGEPLALRTPWPERFSRLGFGPDAFV